MSLGFKRKVRTGDIILGVASTGIKWIAMRQDEITKGKNIEKKRGFEVQNIGEGARKGIVGQVAASTEQCQRNPEKIVFQEEAVHHEMPQ